LSNDQNNKTNVLPQLVMPSMFFIFLELR